MVKKDFQVVVVGGSHKQMGPIRQGLEVFCEFWGINFFSTMSYDFAERAIVSGQKQLLILCDLPENKVVGAEFFERMKAKNSRLQFMRAFLFTGNGNRVDSTTLNWVLEEFAPR